MKLIRVRKENVTFITNYQYACNPKKLTVDMYLLDAKLGTAIVNRFENNQYSAEVVASGHLNEMVIYVASILYYN